MESESFGGSNCLRFYKVCLLAVGLFITFMCKHKHGLFSRVEFVPRKSVESNEFDCMQIHYIAKSIGSPPSNEQV